MHTMYYFPIYMENDPKNFYKLNTLYEERLHNLNPNVGLLFRINLNKAKQELSSQQHAHRLTHQW